MLDRSLAHKVNAELTAAVNAVLIANGLRFKSDSGIDVRRARDGSFGRIMKFDIEPGNRIVSEFTISAATPNFRRNTTLASAMKQVGITKTANSKGDTLTGFYPNRPKYPFVYTSIRGARWKASIEQAQKRFA
jgi:hypothetical protein